MICDFQADIRRAAEDALHAFRIAFPVETKAAIEAIVDDVKDANFKAQLISIAEQCEVPKSTASDSSPPAPGEEPPSPTHDPDQISQKSTNSQRAQSLMHLRGVVDDVAELLHTADVPTTSVPVEVESMSEVPPQEDTHLISLSNNPLDWCAKIDSGNISPKDW